MSKILIGLGVGNHRKLCHPVRFLCYVSNVIRIKLFCLHVHVNMFHAEVLKTRPIEDMNN